MSSITREVKIWSTFEKKLQVNGTVRMKIQDVPQGREMEVAEFMAALFVREETFNKACGVPSNPNAVLEIKKMYCDILNEFPALVCCTDTDANMEKDTPLNIIGCNLMYVSKKDETFDLQFESVEIKKMFEIIKHTEKFNTIYEKYGVTEYLCGAGLSVHPKYRGCGVAVELLKARRPLCEHLGFAVTAAVFTGAGSQRAAERAGYELVAEVDYRSFGELCGGVTFQADVPSFKIQALKI